MEAGVTLAMGFDSGPAGCERARARAYGGGGLSPYEGIVAATQGSARALGLEEVGTLESGTVADLLVVEGDPLADVRMLAQVERIWLVVKDGRPVAGQALAPQLPPG